MEENVEVRFILLFKNFSTFLGKAEFYLENLYIRKEHRGKGYGKEAFKFLASYAKEDDTERIDLRCLDWNQKANDFCLS